eukprot:GSMAST32.ASY1.ANO1.840.1 assembled CDS
MYKFTIFFVIIFLTTTDAVCPNSCSGNGTCNAADICTCYDQGKYTAHVEQLGTHIQKRYTGADCSQYTCAPAFGEWKDRAWHIDQLQTHVDNVECSDAGLCDRTTGVCNCFAGYEGSACQRATCENECSGHGICQSNMQFAKDALARYQDSWDSGNHYGCKCDSGYRGPDCSMKECPSSDDPLLFHGNNQGRDCSGRGVCDYAIGLCTCFSGYTGEDCSKVEALA